MAVEEKHVVDSERHVDSVLRDIRLPKRRRVPRSTGLPLAGFVPGWQNLREVLLMAVS